MARAASQASNAWPSWARGAPNSAITPSPRVCATVPSNRLMFSRMVASAGRSRSIASSGSSPATSSVEPTTSANRTVTCLISASGRDAWLDSRTPARLAPQVPQNRLLSGLAVLQAEHIIDIWPLMAIHDIPRHLRLELGKAIRVPSPKVRWIWRPPCISAAFSTLRTPLRRPAWRRRVPRRDRRSTPGRTTALPGAMPRFRHHGTAATVQSNGSACTR